MHDIEIIREHFWPIIKVVALGAINLVAYSLAVWVIAMVVLWWLGIIASALLKRGRDVER